MKYIIKHREVNAEQFSPDKQPWPNGVKYVANHQRMNQNNEN